MRCKTVCALGADRKILEVTHARYVKHMHCQHTMRRRLSFIRKHIFSLDHKVIGKQYYGLGPGGRVWLGWFFPG